MGGGSRCRDFVDHLRGSGHEIQNRPISTGHSQRANQRQSVRDVRLEDLLGREPVEFDLESVKEANSARMSGAGAAGSIGSELCRQSCTSVRQADLSGHNETGNFICNSNSQSKKVEANLLFCVTDLETVIDESSSG